MVYTHATLDQLRNFHFAALKMSTGMRREVHRLALELCSLEAQHLIRQSTLQVKDDAAMCAAYEDAYANREYPLY